MMDSKKQIILMMVYYNKILYLCIKLILFVPIIKFTISYKSVPCNLKLAKLLTGLN